MYHKVEARQYRFGQLYVEITAIATQMLLQDGMDGSTYLGVETFLLSTSHKAL